MGWYTVEMHGAVREVYSVEADSAGEAVLAWDNGVLVCSEAANMEFYNVQEVYDD